MKIIMNEGLDFANLFRHHRKEEEPEYHYHQNVDSDTARDDNRLFYKWVKENYGKEVLRNRRDTILDIMKSDNTLKMKTEIAKSIFDKSQVSEALNEKRIDAIIKSLLKEEIKRGR